MTSTRARALWVLAGIVGLVLGFLVVERIRGAAGLRAWERAARARGERLTVAELTPPISTDPKVKVIGPSEMQSLLGSAYSSPEYPSPMLLVAPGKARVAWATDSWSQRNGHKDTNSWAELAPSLDRLREGLPLVREALTNHTVQVALDYEAGFNLLLPHLAKYKAAVQGLDAAALYALRGKRLDEAFDNLMAATALVELARQDRLVIGQLVCVGMGALAQATVWEALQADGWTDGQLAALQQAWEQQQFVRGYAEGLRMERAMAAVYYVDPRRTLQDYQSGFGMPVGGSAERESGTFAELFGPMLEKGDELRRALFFLVWRIAWAKQDQLFHHQTIQTTVDLCEAAAVERHWKTPPASVDDEVGGPLRAGPAGLGYYNRLRHWLSAMALPSLQAAADKAVRLDVLREMTVAAIALKRYHLRYGTYPDRLDQLVPQYLAQVPQDWYDGQPLRYRKRPDGTWTLYSVSQDGRDDGGNGGPRGEGYRLSLMTGLDLVWPQPATPEEVRAAEQQRRSGP